MADEIECTNSRAQRTTLFSMFCGQACMQICSKKREIFLDSIKVLGGRALDQGLCGHSLLIQVVPANKRVSANVCTVSKTEVIKTAARKLCSCGLHRARLLSRSSAFLWLSCMQRYNPRITQLQIAPVHLHYSGEEDSVSAMLNTCVMQIYRRGFCPRDHLYRCIKI